MGTVKFSDEWRDAPQFSIAGPVAAFGWVQSVLYCNAYRLMDCKMPVACARIFLPRTPLKRLTARLVDNRLWRINGDTLTVLGHDELFWLGSADRQPISDSTRERVMRRDGLTCGICGNRVAYDDVHIDHIKPVILGGDNSVDNLRVTHSTCNLRRPKRPAEFVQ